MHTQYGHKESCRLSTGCWGSLPRSRSTDMRSRTGLSRCSAARGKSTSGRSTPRLVGARGDRGKLLYELSPSGRKALVNWLAQPDSGPQQLHEDIYVKLLLATRVANGSLPALLGRQKRAYLQRLRDLNQLEERARRDGRSDLARLIRGALLHTEADLKWVDELAADTHGGKTE